jgi:hypothetical protein
MSESTTTLEIHDDVMPYDEACAECGKPAAIVITVRDWTNNHNGYPSTHLLCIDCAEQHRQQLTELLTAARRKGPWREAVEDFLRKGRFIDAIKEHRHRTGATLKTAKAIVEQVREELREAGELE